MLSDPWFYAIAIPAVLLTGISKSGFGGAIGVLSVPILTLAMSPIQAAAILLPILCLMDLMGLWAYRGKWATDELRRLLPAAMIGIAAGTLLFGFINADVLRLVLGMLALVFAVHYWRLLRTSQNAESKPVPESFGVAAAAASGFTSFIAHAGGPPLNMYMLRRNLDKTTFVATAVAFFTVVNYVKLVPYWWLGQLAFDNLKISLVLAPFAPVGIALGIWLHNRIPDRRFFQLACLFLFALSLKLISDGARGLL